MKCTALFWKSECSVISELFIAHIRKAGNKGRSLILIIIFINWNLVITRWQWLFYMYTNMEKKKVTRKFKSGGLHERHVVAIWKLGNHHSFRL